MKWHGRTPVNANTGYPVVPAQKAHGWPAVGLRQWHHGAPLLLAVAITGILGAIGGCGYAVRPMYPMEVRTVYVPMVESEIFRRDVEFRLTEALVKEVEEKTPYKVVDRSQADTMLRTRIVAVTKRVLNEAPTDEPRNVQVQLIAEVAWHDLRNGLLLSGPHEIPLPAAYQRVVNTAEFVPEIGESFATASQEAVDDLAEHIVAMMEEPW